MKKSKHAFTVSIVLAAAVFLVPGVTSVASANEGEMTEQRMETLFKEGLEADAERQAEIVRILNDAAFENWYDLNDIVWEYVDMPDGTKEGAQFALKVMEPFAAMTPETTPEGVRFGWVVDTVAVAAYRAGEHDLAVELIGRVLDDLKKKYPNTPEDQLYTESSYRKYYARAVLFRAAQGDWDFALQEYDKLAKIYHGKMWDGGQRFFGELQMLLFKAGKIGENVEGVGRVVFKEFPGAYEPLDEIGVPTRPDADTNEEYRKSLEGADELSRRMQLPRFYADAELGRLTIIDENGNAIPGALAFVQVQPANDRLPPYKEDWMRSDANGEIPLWAGYVPLYVPDLISPDDQYRVFVKAPGYAAAIVPLDVSKLPIAREIILNKGVKGSVRIIDHEGNPVPDDIRMKVLTAEQSRVLTDVSTRLLQGMTVPVPQGDGVFSFQMARDWEDISLVVSDPRIIVGYIHGAYTAEELSGKEPVEIRLPTPASVEAVFHIDKFTDGMKAADAKAQDYINDLTAQLNIELRTITGYPGKIKTSYNSPLVSRNGVHLEPAVGLRADKLAPGQYEIYFYSGGAQYFVPNDNRFKSEEKLILAAGEEKNIVRKYGEKIQTVVAAPNDYKGDTAVTIRARRFSGTPVSSAQVALIAYPRGSSPVIVGEKETDENGDITFKNLKVPSYDRFRLIKQRQPGQMYGERIGSVDLSASDRKGLVALNTDKDTAPKELTLTVTMPRDVGDPNPGLEYVNVTSGEKHQLDELKGKLVYLDFWATWCGPCQDPMAELNELTADKGETWADDLVMLAVSVDDKIETLKAHNKEKGWEDAQHVWIDHPQGGWPEIVSEGWGVSGIPTSFLLDRKGTIIWRGHPGTITLHEKLEEAIEAHPGGGI